jgi:hypothetical protein
MRSGGGSSRPRSRWPRRSSAIPGSSPKRFRATFDVAIDTGPVTSDERTANDASVTAGTLSREGGMAANGVADVDAEIAQMNADPLNKLELGIKRATMLQSA